MSDKVVPLHCTTTLDIPPGRVLDAAKEQEIDPVVVIGRNKDGELYLASSTGDILEVNWLLDLAKRELLAGRD